MPEVLVLFIRSFISFVSSAKGYSSFEILGKVAEAEFNFFPRECFLLRKSMEHNIEDESKPPLNVNPIFLLLLESCSDKIFKKISSTPLIESSRFRFNESSFLNLK